MNTTDHTHSLFFEIGSEEIPAGFLPIALSALKERFVAHLEKQGIPLGQVRTLGTPRRLVLHATGLPMERPRVSRVVMGPPARAAFDASGEPTRAAQGFARAQGLEPSALFVEDTPKGPYVAVRKEEGGEPLGPMFEQFLPELVRALPFKKSMRWADSELRFARPIHWFVATFAGAVVPFELEGIRSGSTSHGMRFFGPRRFEADTYENWLAGCKAAYITPDPADRRARVQAQLEQLAATVGGRVDLDAHLLDEATYLTECPRVVLGHFEPHFLEMPAEVAVTVMKHHQRYFPVYDEAGRLKSVFLAVINTPTDVIDPIARGNERVLRARLTDGQFFWQEDLKQPLEAYLEALSGIVFHARLGSSKEKVARVVRLSGWLSEQRAPGNASFQRDVARAALLAKADLVTRMVGEFPELQGIMGSIYARRSGESEQVAEAIREHYLPFQAGGALPATEVGALVSIADKLDSVVAFIGVGLSPSASADPFALRRQVLGILSILSERDWNLSLRESVSAALHGLTDKLKRPVPEVEAEVLEFLRTRLRGQLIAEGAQTDHVDAVLAANSDRIPDVNRRLAALRKLALSGDFKPLMIAFKRAANITRDQVDVGVPERSSLLPVEAALLDATLLAARSLSTDLAAGLYDAGLGRLLELKAPIDAFFEGVMVMDPDERVRERRLALLHRVTALFNGVADLTRISTEL